MNGRTLQPLPLAKRRAALLKLLPAPTDVLSISATITGDPPALMEAARDSDLEGIVAKRLDSPYEPGERSGKWMNCKAEKMGTFIIGGYIPNGRTFEEWIVGVKDKEGLRYVANVRAGFVQATRSLVMERIEKLTTPECPFSNLPEEGKARWGVPWMQRR